LRRPPPWLSRSFTGDNGPSKPKASKINKSSAQGQEIRDGNIRYFEETPDGDRREVEGEDANEELLRETVEATLRNFDDVMGQKSKELGIPVDDLEKEYGMSQEELEEGLDTFGGEMGEEDLDGEYSGQQWSQQWSTDDFEQMAQSEDFDGSTSEDFFMKQMTEEEREDYYEQESMADRMVAQMEKYKDRENFTEEDKAALRKELLAGLEEDPIDSRDESNGLSIRPIINFLDTKLNQMYYLPPLYWYLHQQLKTTGPCQATNQQLRLPSQIPQQTLIWYQELTLMPTTSQTYGGSEYQH